MSKAVIYARVSSREQEKEGYSIPAQLKLLNDYADKNGLKVVQEFTDNETAKKTGRTNFNAMLKYLDEKEDVNIILVEKTDRLYRNFKDYVTLNTDSSDLEVHLVKEGSVLNKDSKSNEKFIHGIKVLMAKNYIDNLSEEVKKGMYEKASQGYWPSKVPYGYKRIDGKTIEIDPEKAPFVMRAFELYAEGNISFVSLSKQLYDEGYIFKLNSPKARKSTIEYILKNLFYTGDFIFSGKFYKGNHPSIIQPALFDKAQLSLKKVNNPVPEDRSFPFSGLIKCGICGCQIVAEVKKKKYVYYHCTWGKGKDVCDQKTYIREEELEKQFERVVERINVCDQQKEWIIEGLKRSFDDVESYHDGKVSNIRKQSERLNERIRKIYIDKLDGLVTEEFWYECHNKWKSELTKMNNLINAMEQANIRYLETGILLLELANNAHRMYLQQSPHEKRMLLKNLLSNCTLKDGKLSYKYEEPFDILAKGLNKKENWAILGSNQ